MQRSLEASDKISVRGVGRVPFWFVSVWWAHPHGACHGQGGAGAMLLYHQDQKGPWRGAGEHGLA